MKKKYFLKITCSLLAYQLVFNVATAQKITVLPTQVTAESGVEDGQKLFDEQTIAGDPKNNTGGACANNWLPGWVSMPHHAYVDLGQNYNITDIYLYDYNGDGAFTVSSGSPSNWTVMFVDSMKGWQSWNAHPVTVNTRYLRFTTAVGDSRAYEVVLYGSAGAPSNDSVAPGNVTNLATGAVTSSSVALSWTAPGDDGNTGTATSYDIRYSTTNITNDTDFNNAFQASGEPAPLVAGSTQNFIVTGLLANTQYYFALKTSDEKPNASALSNVPNATTSAASGGGLPPLNKIYIHLPSMDPQWNTTPVYPALEPADFDAHWAALLAGLPAPDPSWNGGNINIGALGNGYGLINLNGASSSSKKPILVMLPSAGAAPGTGICPSDSRFIVCSAMNNASGSVSGAADYEKALLAIQQMIRNIQASGNATSDVFVIGKSQGGGTGLMTSALNADVKSFFLSVPALSGYTGSGGTTGAYPGWPSNNTNGYVDACNHAKRYRNKAFFSISYDDAVTWGRGQVTDAKNTQFTTTIYHGNDGHNDPNWWSLGTDWLDSAFVGIVNNGVGLPGTSTGVNAYSNSSDIKVFPNPNNGVFTMVSSIEGNYSIINELGQVIRTFSISSNNNYSYTIDNLSTGIYFIVGVNNNNVTRQKVVVTK